MVSEIFDPNRWDVVSGFDFEDITYHRATDQGTVRIAFDRPEVRNAFRPQTVDELYVALNHARETSDVGVVLLTGNGPSPKDQGWLSVPEEIKEYVAKTVTNMKTRGRPTRLTSVACIFWKYRG